MASDALHAAASVYQPTIISFSVNVRIGPGVKLYYYTWIMLGMTHWIVFILGSKYIQELLSLIFKIYFN